MGNRIFANYKDDGPNGFCGQSMSITCKFNKLYIFNKREDFKRFESDLKKYKGRKNPRIEYVWEEGYAKEDVIEIKGE